MKSTRLTPVALALISAFGLQPSAFLDAAPLGTTFTYQGRLNEGGQPASGIYDLRSAICDLPSGGGPIAGPITNSPVAVSNGLFTITLDFGPGVFNGNARWLELGVRTNGAAMDFTPLTPRQPLTATPYALHAPSAGSAAAVTGPVSASQLTGTILPQNIAAGSLTTVMLAAGAVGSNQLAAGAVTTRALAEGSVTAAKVATVSNWFALVIANPTPAASENFGRSVAAVGTNRVLIGAWQDDTGAADAGAAYLFSTEGALLTTFTNPTPAMNDRFGYAVAAVGTDRVLIGATGDDTGANNAGAAYLLSANGAWLTTFTNPAPWGWEEFGSCVAAVGTDRVLIGARYGAEYAGAAYLFSTESYTPGLVTDGVNARSITTASLQDGAVTLAKLDSAIGVWTRSGDNVFRLAGNVGIRTANPGFTLEVNGSAGKPGGGSWSVASDERLKKNIRPLAGVLDRLLALHGVNFEYKDPAKIHELSGERMGLIAQEVEQVFPDWVETGPDGYKRVTVRGLEALMVEALRELQQKQEANDAKLAEELKRRGAENAELNARLERLEQSLNEKLSGRAK